MLLLSAIDRTTTMTASPTNTTSSPSSSSSSSNMLTAANAAVACCYYCCLLSASFSSAFILPPTPPHAVHLCPIPNNNEDGAKTTQSTTTTGAPLNSTIPVIKGNSKSNSNNNSSNRSNNSSCIWNNELFISSTNDNADDDFESNDNQDDLDFVGAGTLGDIMSGFGGGERSSGSLLDDAFSIHHSIASSSSLSSITSSPIPTSTSTSANFSPPIIDGLVTKEGGELNFRYNCNFTPMERIALTANGNLQRIFSSYYDAPIHVRVDSCVRRRPPFHPLPPPPQQRHDNDDNDNDNEEEEGDDDEIAIWDRVVHLTLHNHTTLCKATSIIHVTSPSCIQLIESGSVGLGQMFRYLNKLPTFSLLDAGRRESGSGISSGVGSGGGRTKRRMRKSDFENGSGEAAIDENDEFDRVLETQEGYLNEFPAGGGMWRTYKLQCEEMTCLIHEEFHRDAWDLL